ncbi:MAG: thermonuclease family protein [Cyclobacteriaceae bacterium]
MKRIVCLLVAVVFYSFVFAENDLTGKVVSVIDGNTIELMAQDNETYKISLFGIDCPEIGQDYGDHAKDFLQKMILNKKVDVRLQGKDRWGNSLGIILIDGKVDPRLELLEAGLAWTSERNPIVELESMRERAKENGKGLWKDKEPTPPWIYRRQQSMAEPKFR